MRTMARLTPGMAAAALLAVTFLVTAAPQAKAAPPEGFRGHAVARGSVPMRSGPVRGAPVMRGMPQAHGGMHFNGAPARIAAPPAPLRFAAAPRDRVPFDAGERRDWHDGGRFDGDRRDGDRHDWRGDGDRGWGRPRYAVPPHWIGRHPDWDDGHRPGYWVRPWGPQWEPHYWAGGDWDGRFWPHVYLDWDFPWFLAGLPAGYVTYWWGGVPYYYWRGVYYVWSPDYGQYVVTDPPPLTGGSIAGAAPPPSSQASGGNPEGALSLYVYPKNGQSQQQTDDDRYQCHEWAVGQTGYDPTDPSRNTQASTATASNYKRAVTACLEARGYSVR